MARDERRQAVADDSDKKAGEEGFRTHGKPEDSRDDLPQVVVGMAVTRDGIPVRVWSWPGNTADSALIRQVRDDIREWTLSRVIWVADRGFASAQNRRALMRGGGGYIIGEKLHSGSAEAKAALSRQGRYATHRREDRIRAHVVLCWLALLLIRVTETRTGQTWGKARAELQRMHAVTWSGPAGTFRQATDPTKPQRDIYTALGLDLPRKIIAIEPAPGPPTS